MKPFKRTKAAPRSSSRDYRRWHRNYQATGKIMTSFPHMEHICCFHDANGNRVIVQTMYPTKCIRYLTKGQLDSVVS